MYNNRDVTMITGGSGSSLVEIVGGRIKVGMISMYLRIYDMIGLAKV